MLGCAGSKYSWSAAKILAIAYWATWLVRQFLESGKCLCAMLAGLLKKSDCSW